MYANEHAVAVTASWDGAVQIYDDTEDGGSVLLRRMTGGHAGDVTALAFSYHLNLVATGASDGAVVVWDFEFCRLLGRTDRALASVTNLRFVDPYPLLLSSDGAGAFHLWAAPPSSEAFCCLAAWRSDWEAPERFRPAPGASTAVLAFSLAPRYTDDAVSTRGPARRASAVKRKDGGANPLDALAACKDDEARSAVQRRRAVDKAAADAQRPIESYLLLSGDDRGAVVVWDLLPLLDALEASSSRDVKRLKRPVHCENERRNLRYDASAVSRTSDPTAYAAPRDAYGAPPPEPDVSMTVQTADDVADARRSDARRREDALVASTVRFAASRHLAALLDRRTTIKAHGDGVLCVNYISETGSMITSGLDRLVHVWTLDGERLGTLRQGVAKETSSRPGGQAPRDTDWRFRTSDATHRRRRAGKASEALREMRELERDQKAAAAAAFAAMKPATGSLPQLTETGHFVLNATQMAYDPDAPSDAAAGVAADAGPELDALADLSDMRSSLDKALVVAPPTAPRRRPKPVGPANAGRRLVAKMRA